MDDPEDPNYVTLVDRDEWEALPTKRMIPIKYPIDKVLVTVDNHFGACEKKKYCIKNMKNIQMYYIFEKHLVDIPYNFMIGYDGLVYEGRGWNVKSHISEFNPEYKENTIDIGIMSSDDNLAKPGMDAMITLKKFINYWISKNIISKDHTIRLL